MSLSVRVALAASFTRALPTTLCPRLSVSLPSIANAYGFVTVTMAARLTSAPVPGRPTLGPDLRIDA